MPARRSTLIFRVLRAAFLLGRALRLAPFRAKSDAELAENAHGLAYAILATLWLRRVRAPSWDAIYAQWRARSSAGGAVNPALYGVFGPEDRMELLTGNAQAFDRRDELYRSAAKSLDIATYYVQADEAGWRSARAWADCARRGVRVRIVADRWMMERKAFANPNVSELVGFLRQAGVEFRLYADPRRPYDICHAKMLIVDAAVLVTGGRNYAAHYAVPGWRDLDIQLSGPAARRAQAAYDAMFAGAPAAQNGLAPSPAFHPAAPSGIASNAIFLYLVECIRAARQTLDIENAYYFSHPVVHAALAEACRRGVRVRLFTNSADSNDLDFMNYRLYAGFPDLLRAGVLLYLRKGRGRTLHSKYFVADGEWVGLGTGNLDFFSPRFCLDLGVHVRDRELGEALTAWFEQGISEAGFIGDLAPVSEVLAAQRASRTFDRWMPDIQ